MDNLSTLARGTQMIAQTCQSIGAAGRPVVLRMDLDAQTYDALIAQLAQEDPGIDPAADTCFINIWKGSLIISRCK